MKQLYLSRRLAVDSLLNLDPAETAVKSGGRFDAGEKALKVDFLGRAASFDYRRADLFWDDTEEPVISTIAIVILHYLANAEGDPPSGSLLAYRDLWGAGAQSGPFIDRPEKLLAEKYASTPSSIIAKSKDIGASVTEKHGDARLDLTVLPHLSFSIFLYAADDEFPAAAKILYDSVAGQYLPTEDAAWLAGHVARLLTEDLS